eukprot:CAMPEP_0171748782 /NCGR_PEP_ID=MMETSP0991-20121206/40331_1 /TAXON_ID=483369 /ORGANISM="non described non described, Strain CCMP2098" /LENGTH=49 /DNA_ID=CAMNT_0012349251 /DNA_START=76 /DNA_END=225 /DNA_ORIENTATION=+
MVRRKAVLVSGAKLMPRAPAEKEELEDDDEEEDSEGRDEEEGEGGRFWA